MIQIKDRERDIEDLKETLKVPRQHFRYIERLTTEEIIKQKDVILQELALNLGVPLEGLISKMY
jgi:hypothetical protein